MRITGFPTLAIAVNGRLRLLTYGYRPIDALRPIVVSALETRTEGD
jgi:protein-disulfide isomerase-like protein with CxxC motif